MMLTSDLCLAYKNNPGYDECMVREREAGRKSASEKVCRAEVSAASTDLDPRKEECCAWVCISTLQKTRILNFKVDRSRIEDYCGYDLLAKAKNNQKLCCDGMREKGRYTKGVSTENFNNRGQGLIRDCDAY